MTSILPTLPPVSIDRGQGAQQAVQPPPQPDQSATAPASSGGPPAAPSDSTGSSSGTPQDRVSAQIDAQVQSGSLTADQANTLRQFFAGGGPASPSTSPTDQASPPSNDVASGPQDSTGQPTSASDLFQSFLDEYKKAQAAGYGPSGNAASGATSALFIDTQA